MGLSASRARRILVATAGVLATAALLAGCATAPEVALVTSVPRVELPAAEPVAQPGDGPECPTMHCVSVVVSGDLLFHHSLWNQYKVPTTAEGANFDFVPLLEGQTRYLERSDLAICQMETPLAPTGGPYSAFPIFSIPPEVATAAKAVGYDICTTSSNHSVDQRTAGLVRTLDTLDAAGLPSTGTYRAEGESDVPLIVEANGVKIALIAATFSLNGLRAEHDWQVDYPLDTDRAIAKAQAARAAGAEIVLGAAHVGTEYSTNPDSQQIAYAHTLIDSGEFDFVYQHHTHSILPMEQRDGKWIVYSLGNTISESAPAERRVNNEFLMVRLQFVQQEDGSWVSGALDWNVATNKQDGRYKWCPVNTDKPQGVCQSESFDAGVLERSRTTINKMGAAEAGAREWKITEEQGWAQAVAAEQTAAAFEQARKLAVIVHSLWRDEDRALLWDGEGYSAPDLTAFTEADPQPTA